MPARAATRCGTTEARAHGWLAVRIRPGRERDVVASLRRQGVEVYLPERHHRKIWSRSYGSSAGPLFPGYAFALFDSSVDWEKLLRISGLEGFASFRGGAATIPAKQLEDLRLLLEKGVPFCLHPCARVGWRVRLRGGKLEGVEGVLFRQEHAQLAISIEPIRRSLAIDIRGYELELV